MDSKHVITHTLLKAILFNALFLFFSLFQYLSSYFTLGFFLGGGGVGP